MPEKTNLKWILLIAVALAIIGILPKILKNTLVDYTLATVYFFYIGLSFLSFYGINFFWWFFIPTRSYQLKYALGFLSGFIVLGIFHGLLWSINREGFVYLLGLKTILPTQVLFITGFRAFLLQCMVLVCLFFFKNKEDKITFQSEINRLNQHLEALKNKPNPEKSYQNTLLTRFQNQVVPLDISEIAFFYLAEGIVILYLFSQQKYTQSVSLETLENTLDPQFFFRANRRFLIHRKAVEKIEQIEHRKLNVRLSLATPEEIIISKAKSTAFVKWLGKH